MAIGCSVDQIEKSLIIKTKVSSRPILVIASGPNRVDEHNIAALIGEEIGRADAGFVRQPITIFIDEDLLVYDEIWAAAGTPKAVFRLTGADLVAAAGGRVIKVK